MTRKELDTRVNRLNNQFGHALTNGNKFEWSGYNGGYRLVLRHANTGVSDISPFVRTARELGDIIDTILEIGYRDEAGTL